MSFETLLDSIPHYARDLRVNLGNVMRQTELTPQQLWGTAVAAAVASRNPQVIRGIAAGAAGHLSPEAAEAARTAAALMAMNNIYYRFQHSVEDEAYSSVPAKLRMQGLRTHGISQVDFELWCTAVSAVNNCSVCMRSHERVLREKGLTVEQIAAGIRVAAVVAAIAAVAEEQAASATGGAYGAA